MTGNKGKYNHEEFQYAALYNWKTGKGGRQLLHYRKRTYI